MNRSSILTVLGNHQLLVLLENSSAYRREQCLPNSFMQIVQSTILLKLGSPDPCCGQVGVAKLCTMSHPSLAQGRGSVYFSIDELQSKDRSQFAALKFRKNRILFQKFPGWSKALKWFGCLRQLYCPSYQVSYKFSSLKSNEQNASNFRINK